MSVGRSTYGVSIEKCSSSARAVINRWKYSDELLPVIWGDRTSASERPGSGITVPIDLHAGTEPVALSTGTERGVERETAGSSSSKLSPSSMHARCSLKVDCRCGSSGSRSTRSITTTPPPSRNAVPRCRSGDVCRTSGHQSADDHRDRVFDPFAEFGHPVQGVRRAVHPTPAKPLCLQRRESRRTPLRPRDHGRQHLEAWCPGHLQDLVHHLPKSWRTFADPGANRKVVDLLVMVPTVDRGQAGRLLIDAGYRRAQAFDEIDVRLVELAEELPTPTGIPRTGADPRFENGVEREAGFAGTGQTW